MKNHGFIKVAAASPKLKVADCKYNTEQILELIKKSDDAGVSVVVFPELSITSYTCADLFNQELLIQKADEYLNWLCNQTKDLSIAFIVGLPVSIGNKLYNCAAICSYGNVHGIVPKTYIPNYGEFYEKRWFSSSNDLSNADIANFQKEQNYPICINTIFEIDECRLGIEICEDLWAPIPPSTGLALNGADILFNLSASNETVGKHIYRENLVSQQSARCLSGYVYASASTGESTTDLVFSGTCLIAENGTLLAQGERYTFENQLTIADIDIERLRQERIRNKSFHFAIQGTGDQNQCKTIQISPTDKLNILHVLTSKSDKSKFNLSRIIPQKPFVPENKDELNTTCQEIFAIQTTGLIKRMMHTGTKDTVIGISGGLDSTLALLVLVYAYDKMGIDRKHIWGITMPGFGTSDRTYQNALKLMATLNISSKEIPIREAVTQHFSDIGHDIKNKDVTYENSQARERTQILMDYANKVNGMVIGTGDLSELALGWCTYNGDHMSMYGLNGSVPKTLVKALVKWVADYIVSNDVQVILHDVVDTPVSPELLPSDKAGEIGQITEDTVGPYILHDFFLYYMLRFGFTPSKIFYLTQYSFKGSYSDPEIIKWLKVFYRRFFTQQFKRSCLPDGPKVGSVSLSPRGDWRMPSDASIDLWSSELDEIEKEVNK